jgi:excisionase family DNA binding protein
VIPRLRYSIAEASQALGIGKTQMETLIREHNLTVHQDTPGGHRYISVRSLDEYIREQEEKPVFGRRRAS